MTYKKFIGSVAYCDEDHVFHGKIEGIQDLVTFESDHVDGLRKAFEDAVDDYTAFNLNPKLLNPNQ